MGRRAGPVFTHGSPLLRRADSSREALLPARGAVNRSNRGFEKSALSELLLAQTKMLPFFTIVGRVSRKETRVTQPDALPIVRTATVPALERFRRSEGWH